MIQDVFAKPLRWTADKLGWRLGLRDADRTRLVIGTIGGIDVNKHARLARRKKRNKEAKAAKRHAAGAKPRKASLARTEPWKQLGMSRATWFRRSKPKPPVRRHNETVETVSGTPDEDICSSLQSKFDLALHATSARANAALRPLQSKELPERRAKARARLS
jgi:hypothetical protein